jgi:hypothetical protein
MGRKRFAHDAGRVVDGHRLAIHAARPSEYIAIRRNFMFALELIQLIETRAEPLSEGLLRKLKKNDRCIELLRQVSSDELRSRSHEIYRNLNDWRWCPEPS